MPPSSQPARWLIVLAFATIYIIWGSTYLAISFAVQTVPPFVMSTTRFLLAGGLLLAWTLGRGTPLPTRVHWRSAFITGAFLFGLNNSLLVGAEHGGLPTGIAALLIATTPMWMVLLNWLRPGGERPGASVFAGLALGTLGIVLLVNPGNTAGVDPIGAVMVIAAALCWSIGSLYARGAAAPSNILLSIGMQLVAGGLMQVVLAVVSGEAAHFDPTQVTALSLGSLAYLAIMSSIIAFAAFSWLMRVTNPARVATHAYVNPVVAVFLGWVLNHEPLQSRTIVAAAIIVFAVVLIARDKGRAEAKHTAIIETQELATETV